MERRRSPRSSKSSGTTFFPRSSLAYESYKSGCSRKLTTRKFSVMIFSNLEGETESLDLFLADCRRRAFM
ncbi:hypothetical protein YC2023_069873 [Brassica napus]